MLVVDSTVWVDYFNGVRNPQTDYLHETVDRTPILVGDLILAEALQDFREDADFERARRAGGSVHSGAGASRGVGVNSLITKHKRSMKAPDSLLYNTGISSKLKEAVSWR